MIEAYYGNTTGINGMDIRGILEQSPNIPKRESFFLSVYTENENDSGGEIIGEWLKTTPQRCHYFTSSIAPFDLIFPHDPSHILPRCLLDSRVESK